MRHFDRSRKRFSLTSLATAAVLCCSIILLAGVGAEAQSGRRVSKGARASTPLPSQPQPTPAAALPKPDQMELYVVLNERDPFLNIPLYLHDTIMRAFIQRLAEASSIKVTPGKEMHRSEAIKHAKGETSAHVVLVQLDVDTFDSRRSANADPTKLSIRYSVFAPVTGKSETEGVVFQQDYRVGRGAIGLPTRRTAGGLYSDFLLREAAREAANRVLASLHITQPPRPPGATGN
ncbi:MAG TPA: hypothetical protein VGC89_09575 [Pyrinomonadaceae bacterium]